MVRPFSTSGVRLSVTCMVAAPTLLTLSDMGKSVTKFIYNLFASPWKDRAFRPDKTKCREKQALGFSISSIVPLINKHLSPNSLTPPVTMESVGMFSSIQRAVARSGQTSRARTAPVHPGVLPRLDENTKRSHFPRQPKQNKTACPLPRRSRLTVAAKPIAELARNPLPRLHHRNPLRHRRQRGEVRVWRVLIPIPRRVEVIPAIVGVTGLHGVLPIALEGYRIVAVPPVAAVLAAGAL